MESVGPESGDTGGWGGVGADMFVVVVVVANETAGQYGTVPVNEWKEAGGRRNDGVQ